MKAIRSLTKNQLTLTSNQLQFSFLEFIPYSQEIFTVNDSLHFVEKPRECQCQQCLFKRGPRCICGIVSTYVVCSCI